MDFIRLVGPDRVVELFGVRLVGVSGTTLRRVGLTIAFVIVIRLVAALLRAIAKLVLRHRDDVHAQFWSQQAVQILATLLTVVAIISIWVDDPARLSTAAALVTAGLSVALQKVVTSFAAYFLILRGRVFNIGDRITMGGVRGDVISLGYLRTTIMEMGEPPGEQDAPPAMWVEARQYTGRIVSVTNDRIFDEPVYNYTREFPFLWEETHLPIKYTADRKRAEEILLDVARKHTVDIHQLSQHDLDRLEHRYHIQPAELAPRVFLRLTDNWVELTVRYIVRTHGVRELKDAMTRDILAALDEAKIEVASATFEVVGIPPVRVEGAPK